MLITEKRIFYCIDKKIQVIVINIGNIQKLNKELGK